MSEIVVRNLLIYKGVGSWGLAGWDGSTNQQLIEHVDACIANGCNTVAVNLNNEDWMSFFFPGKYMQEGCFDMVRWLKFKSACNYIHSRGLFVCWALFDGPECPNGKYFPTLRQKHLHQGFIQGVCQVAPGLCDFILIGCETDRYFTEEEVDACIGVIHQFLPWMPVGSHEASVKSDGRGGFYLTRNLSVAARRANFWAHETDNHPNNGDAVSPERMAAEIAFLVSKMPCILDKDGKQIMVNGKPFKVPVWVLETSSNLLGHISRKQVTEYSKIEGVFGASGPGL
jgi:hypothetical protein